VFLEYMPTKQNYTDMFLLSEISSPLGGKSLQLCSWAVFGAIAANVDGLRKLRGLVVSDRE